MITRRAWVTLALLAVAVLAVASASAGQDPATIPPVPRIDESRLLREIGACHVRLSVTDEHAAALTERLAQAIEEIRKLKATVAALEKETAK